MSETAPLKNNEKDASASPTGPNYVKVAGMVSMMLAVGTSIAYYGVFRRNRAFYEARIETLLGSNGGGDLHWLYLGLVILGRTVAVLNFSPVGYKKGLSGSIRVNPFFFETVEGKELVLYKEDGKHGMYNRANRSLQHMVEMSGGFFASVAPVGFLYPKAVCGILAVFGAGRILHQNGYAKGYGKHAVGFILTMLSMLTLEGLALVTFLKGHGIL